MQLIAQYFGFKIIKVTGHVANNHKVNFLSGSRYFKESQEERIVNSYHNYSVSGSHEDIIEIARASEGEIEAIEHRSLPIAGMMWHPERTIPFCESDIHLLSNFFNGNMNYESDHISGRSRITS